MKRFIFVMIILSLVFSVFAMNTICAFAEEESDETTGTEETLPEDTEEGGEELPPETGDTEEGGEDLPPETDGSEENVDELPPETEDTENEEDELPSETDEEQTDAEKLNGLFGELGVAFGELKDEFMGIVNDVGEFISSNETYKNIFTALVAILAIILIPILVAILVIAYIVMAATIIIVTALMTLAEGIVGVVVGASAFIL